MTEFGNLIAGAAIGVFASWVAVLWARRSYASHQIFDLRMAAVSDVWKKLLDVQSAYGPIAGLGLKNWQKTHSEEALEVLNKYRASLDIHKIVLPEDVVAILKSLDSYFFLLLHEDDTRPSDYYETVNGLLARLSTSINAMFKLTTHKVELNLDNRIR